MWAPSMGLTFKAISTTCRDTWRGQVGEKHEIKQREIGTYNSEQGQTKVMNRYKDKTLYKNIEKKMMLQHYP